MSQEQSDPVETRRVLAALAACTVQTLTESNPAFRASWTENLEKMYLHLRDQPGSLPVLEVLSMTRDALKIFDK